LNTRLCAELALTLIQLAHTAICLFNYEIWDKGKILQTTSSDCAKVLLNYIILLLGRIISHFILQVFDYHHIIILQFFYRTQVTDFSLKVIFLEPRGSKIMMR
jgi:hypothetical protein